MNLDEKYNWSWPEISREESIEQLRISIKYFFSNNNFSQEEINLYIQHPELIGIPNEKWDWKF